MHTPAQNQGHRPRLEDVRDVQDDVRSQPNRRAAVEHMAEHYPHLESRWINRHLDRLLELDPEALVTIIGYPDPTGEKAVRNVMDAEAARSEREAVAA